MAGENAPGGHAHSHPSELLISAPKGHRQLNMGFKITAIIDFMGTEGISEVLKLFVFT